MLFIYTSYTANIVALLQSTSKKINSLDDLLVSGMEMAADDNPYTRAWFAILSKTDSVRKSIYETKIAPPNQPENFINLTAGVDKIRQVGW